MYRRKDKSMAKPKRRTVVPELEAKVGLKAFRKCRPNMKDFILDIEDGLYSKGIISQDTHDDIHGRSIVESERKRILLDAVERKLKSSKSSTEFDIVVDLFKEGHAYDALVDKLSEAKSRVRESCQLSLTARMQPFRSRIGGRYVYVFTVVAAILLCCVVFDSEENATTQFLKSKYKTYSLELGRSYSKVPYVSLSIFQYPDSDWMTTSQSSHNMTSQPVSLDEILNVSTGDRILIIGGPGSGKTRLTLEIMRLWRDSKVLLSCELLIVCRLRWFSRQKDIDLRSVVNVYMEGGPIVDAIVNEAFSSGGNELCFLFDGLDEYEPGYSDRDNYVYSLMHRRGLSNAVVIVTARNITSTGFEAIEWTRRYHVSGFSDKQLKSYFHNRLNLTHANHMNHSLWQLCRVPLYASLIVNTLSGKPLDSTINTTTQLFEAITRETFESDLRKASEPAKARKYNDLKQLRQEFPVFDKICALAFKGSLSIPRQYNFDDSEIPSELKSTNLSYFHIELQPGAGNMEVYTFIHPTLMDFLAAVHFTSLNQSEQSLLIAKEKPQCRNISLGYDDFWVFVCGLTSHFIQNFTRLYDDDCYKHFWLKPMKITHCIFEAQSHSAHEVQSVTESFMPKDDVSGFLELSFMFVTLTAYDMQAIGYVASIIPNDLIGLTLVSVTVADEDYDLSFLFHSLAKFSANTTFSNFKEVSFRHVISTEIKFEQSFVDFFECTPKLKTLELIDVSWPLVQQMTILAPMSCNSILIYNTSFGKGTPHSLFKQRKQMFSVYVAHCKLKDRHLLDMRSTPWSIDTRLFELSYNSIGNEGAISIATSIKNLCGFANCIPNYRCGPYGLLLNYNNIGGEGLVSLLEAAVCSGLEFIDLTGNEITDNDVDTIIRKCLTLDRPINIQVVLLDNNLTENGEERLKNLKTPFCSLCFEFGCGQLT